VRVVDRDNHPVATGEAGEVVVRGYNVMRGYFEDPAATAEAIDADGWLHTGDIGVLDDRGNLRITDRLKDMYVVGGFNAYPAEIEQVLATHPAVAEAAVVGVPDARMGEVGKAFVVARAGATVDAAELIAYARERMANYKVPRSVEVVETLPRNASGKVLKGELRGWFAAETSAGEAGEPRDEVEAVVASVWAAVLGVARVGVDDDFFALGGHSLAAAQIVARLHDAFDVELPVAAVFESPTVAELAGAVRRAQAAAAPTR
jgi:acyl carrier protein